MAKVNGAALINEIQNAEVAYGHCTIWWLGQQSWALKLGKTVLYLDPFLSDHPSRQIPPAFKPEEVINADVITGSHDHTDHIDRKIWPALAKASPSAFFIVPEYHLKALPDTLGIQAARFKGLNDGNSVEIGGVRITGVPAAHELLSPNEKGLHPFLSFVIEGNGCTVFQGGDMCLYEGLQTQLMKWKFDVMMLPINGRDAERLKKNVLGNMTFQEAVDLAGALEPKVVFPAHYDMFAANSADPHAFKDYLNVKYPNITALVPGHFEKVIL